MFTSSEAIVLQLIPHKDHSAIVKLFTQKGGMLGCWINSVHSKSSGIRRGVLQPLTIVNVVLDQRKHQNMPIVKELHLSVHLSSVYSTIEKSAIAIFMAELLSKCFKEHDVEPFLFNFIKETIILLEKAPSKFANFHILFMLRLSEQLGIFPNGNFSSSTPFIDMEEGIYCERPAEGNPFISPDECEWLSKLSALPMEEFSSIEISSQIRHKILHKLIDYFEIHAGTGRLKSHLVLEQVF